MNFSVKTRTIIAPLRQFKARPLAYFAVAYAGTSAVQKGLGFLLFLWLAHSLPVKEYAVFGLLYALQVGLTTLALAGILEAVIGGLKEHPTPPLRHQLFRGANSALVLMAALAVVVVGVIYFLIMDRATHSSASFAGVIVTGVLTAFFSVQAYLVRLQENHRASLVLGFAPPVAGFAGGYLGFALWHSVVAFYAGSAAGLTLALLLLVPGKTGFAGFTREAGQLRPVLAPLAPFIFIAVLGWISGYGNTYLVELFFAPADVACFAFLYTISSIMELVATAMNQVWSPRFFRLTHELPLPDVERKNGRFFTLQGVALGLIGAAILVVLPLVLGRIGGNLLAYRGHNWEMFFLLAAYACSIPFWHAQNYFLAHRKGPELMRATIYSSILSLVLWFVAVWWFGPPGVYLGFLIRMIIRAASAMLLARREWPIRLAWPGVLAALGCLLAGNSVAIALH